MKTKPGRGKQKGTQFERDVCKWFSLAMTKCDRDDLFWRSAMSGGRATLCADRKNQLGDISTIGPEGFALTDSFVIECKRYRQIGLLQFLVSEKGPLSCFWVRLYELANKNKRYPLLIFQEDRQPMLGLVSSDGIETLNTLIGSDYTILLHHPDVRPVYDYRLIRLVSVEDIKF